MPLLSWFATNKKMNQIYIVKTVINICTSTCIFGYQLHVRILWKLYPGIYQMFIPLNTNNIGHGKDIPVVHAIFWLTITENWMHHRVYFLSFTLLPLPSIQKTICTCTTIYTKAVNCIYSVYASSIYIRICLVQWISSTIFHSSSLACVPLQDPIYMYVWYVFISIYRDYIQQQNCPRTTLWLPEQPISVLYYIVVVTVKCTIIKRQFPTPSGIFFRTENLSSTPYGKSAL